MLEYVLPIDENVSRAYLWQIELYAENNFVGSDNPAYIAGIIDWQSTGIAPLFTVADQPPLLNHAGASLARPVRPKLPNNLRDIQPADQPAARALHYDQALKRCIR